MLDDGYSKQVKTKLMGYLHMVCINGMLVILQWHMNQGGERGRVCKKIPRR